MPGDRLIVIVQVSSGLRVLVHNTIDIRQPTRTRIYVCITLGRAARPRHCCDEASEDKVRVRQAG